ncbi:MAG: metallophosphoesterase [Candidatus Thorarchaeota archaeon]
MTSVKRRNVLAILIKNGFQITPDALDYILKLDTPMKIVESVILSNESIDSSSVLTREYIESLIKGKSTESAPAESLSGRDEEPSSSIVTQSSTVESELNYKIEKNPDQNSVGSEGNFEDFLELFRSRYKQIKKIYMSRIDTQNAVTPDIAKQRKASTKSGPLQNNESGRRGKPPSQVVIGIIRNKNISSQRNIIIDLEGHEDSIICVIPSIQRSPKDQDLSQKANALLLDEIVCISGYVDSSGRMIADDVLFPDIPTVRQLGRAKKEVYAAFISDLHCGSQEFLEDEFDRFIDWIGGRDVDVLDKNMIEKTKYLFIAGDLVDGISVYPNQREHLKISSLYDQYVMIGEKLKKIPKKIRIFCIPGNHDACRQALPKPPILRVFAEPIYNLENVTMLGDPCQILVDGVRILMTHGDSMDDLVTTLPRASYTEPAISMIELLKKRHLAPIYGGKTELAPLHHDWMVIDTPPDVVHFGHAHHNAVDNYRGVQIINSGTFQSQTDFMRKQGVVPTPGIVTFLNLQTGIPDVKFFYDMSK